MTTGPMSEEEVRRIAGLVRLELSDAEVQKFSKTIPQTLKVIEILKELDTRDVPPTSSVTGLTNVFQNESDIPAGLSQREALSNAREVVNGLFATSAVLSK